jgi:hypothetical protein
MKCPKCGSTEARPSRHSKWKDIFHTPLGQQAHRCRSCHARFYAPKPPQSTAAAPSSASADETSRKRHHKSRGGSRRRRRHLIEAGVFALMMIIFIFCLLFITRQRGPGQQSNFISGSFNV